MLLRLVIPLPFTSSANPIGKQSAKSNSRMIPIDELACSPSLISKSKLKWIIDLVMRQTSVSLWCKSSNRSTSLSLAQRFCALKQVKYAPSAVCACVRLLQFKTHCDNKQTRHNAMTKLNETENLDLALRVYVCFESLVLFPFSFNACSLCIAQTFADAFATVSTIESRCTLPNAINARPHIQFALKLEVTAMTYLLQQQIAVRRQTGD